MSLIFAPQIRAARALLGWNQHELAEAASIGVATLRRLEASEAGIRGSVEVLWKIQTALEKAGVEFIPGDESKGPGVRLKRGDKGKGGRRTKR
jgi:transcriptional regulator with XRE-family HTH domain